MMHLNRLDRRDIRFTAALRRHNKIERIRRQIDSARTSAEVIKLLTRLRHLGPKAVTDGG